MRTTDETKGSEVWQPSWQLYSMIITELRGKRYTGEQCLYCLVQDPSMRRPTPVNSFCSFPHFFSFRRLFSPAKPPLSPPFGSCPGTSRISVVSRRFTLLR